MRRLAGAALGWLRRRRSRDPAEAPGAAAALPSALWTYGHALGLTEALICEGVVYPSHQAATAQLARRTDIGTET
ncbi:MAG: hypothetical protein CSA66_00640, partial [Proteobacteria bacterium]